MVCRCGRGSVFREPPGVIRRGGVVAEDQHFRFVCVEFQTVVSHPVGDASHAIEEDGSCGGGVF